MTRKRHYTLLTIEIFDLSIDVLCLVLTFDSPQRSYANRFVSIDGGCKELYGKRLPRGN